MIFLAKIIFVFVIIYNFFRLFKARKIFVDDITIISFGYIYYLILPLIYIRNKYLVDVISKYTNDLTEQRIIFVSILSLFYYIVYVSCSEYFKKKLNIRKHYEDLNYTTFNIILLVLFLIGLYFIYLCRDSLFKGYDSFNPKKSSLAGISTLLLYISIVGLLRFHKKRFLLLYFIISLCVVSMGTRLYFVAHILSFIIYYINNKKITMKFVLLIMGLIIFVLSAGIIRAGNKVSFEGLIYIFLAEPMFCDITLFTALTMNESIPFISFPLEFLSAFINLIPGFIFPNKDQIMNNIIKNSSSFVFENPLGAKSIYVSLFQNFGWFGSVIAIIIFCFIINKVKKYNEASYLTILGFMAFSLFRDPLSVSIVKAIFEFSIFVPLLCFWFNDFMKISCKKIY